MQQPALKGCSFSTDIYMHTPRPNLYDYLKVIAIITMIIDHVWFLFFPELEILRVIWRAAFPLFLFLVWYNHSYRHRSTLRISGIVLQLILWIWWYYGLTDMRYLNILLSIWITRWIMLYIQKRNILRGEIVIYILCAWLAGISYEYIDYGTLCVVFALLWYRVRKYGNNTYVTWAIFVSMCYHLIFMYTTRGFDEQIWWLCIVWILLFIAMYMMSKQNYVMVSSHIYYDKTILFLSKHALWIYIWQAVVLSLLLLLV